jgi:hypothetical protein
MSWLAAEAGLAPVDDVLMLQEETYGLWLEVLRRTGTIVDGSLLSVCRARMGQIHERPAGIDAAGTRELARWRDSDAFSELERAALDYLEQMMIDPSSLSAAQKERLASSVSQQGLADFAFAAFAHDADLRARTLLEIEPDSSQYASREPVSLADGRKVQAFPKVDPSFGEALARFGHDASAHSLVDETTTEVCRLRNAWFQQRDT